MNGHDYRNIPLYLNEPTIDSFTSRFDLVFLNKLLSNKVNLRQINAGFVIYEPMRQLRDTRLF